MPWAGQSKNVLVAAAADTTAEADAEVPRPTVKDKQKKAKKQTPPKRRESVCSICGRPFASRNELFHHLKTDETCAAAAGYDIVKGQEVQTDRVALLVAYDSNDTAVSSEQFGSYIRDSFDHGLAAKYAPNMTTTSPSVQSYSQVTVPKCRHVSLAQEDGCSALGDVLVLSYTVPAFASTAMSTQDVQTLRSKHMNEILRGANAYLDVTFKPTHNIEVLSYCLLEPDSRLHAERGCTQRAYHYLFPLRWLPGGADVANWWLENRREQQDNSSWSEQERQQEGKNEPRRHKRSFGGVSGGEFRARKPPPNPSMRLLKEAMRQAESKELSGEEIEEANADDRRRVASGRFGALGFKERRCWANYAASKLQGLASPSNEPVWKTLERARIVDFTSASSNGDDDQDVILILEFRGEDFIEESVRRIVGTTVAMIHEWLPNDFFELSTRPDIMIETPLAPAGRLYFAGARFHFHELVRGGESLFEDFLGNALDGDLSITWSNEMRRHMLDRVLSAKDDEKRWVEELEQDVCPRIRKELAKIEKSSANEAVPVRTSEAPVEYTLTLHLLRQIISSRQWPETSEARSRVIRDDSHDCLAGSFTVVNPRFRSGILVDASSDFVPPLANELFPDLSYAVFELEKSLAPDRPASSHCAVNCKAQFLPHVDSGRGAGQSLSMIVGLGDYGGGDIVVESMSHDIRYAPLEFDGWRERHWTDTYNGERFSLVWFTPEMDITCT